MKKLFVLLLCLGATGCATAPPPPQAEPYVANFDYAPQTQEPTGSSGVTFAVGNTGYKTNDKKMLWFTYPQFGNLNSGLKQDLPEILIAKGFSVRGPFDSYDLIPYSDKKAIDLFLIPTVELLITFKDTKQEVENIFAAPPVDILTGNVEVNGKIILELREIVTRELMWSKNIPFAKFEFPYRVRHSAFYDKPGQPFDLKPLVMNEVAQKIEEQYPGLMATLAQLIDPEEMRIIKEQAQKLKNQKGY